MPTYTPILDAEVAAEQPVTVSLMTRLRDNALSYLGAPAGTRSTFQQTAAPLGWTKDTSQHDKVYRVTSGAATTGGVQAFSTVFGRTATDGYTFAQANLPLGLNFAVSSSGPLLFSVVDRYRQATQVMQGGTTGAGPFNVWTGAAADDVQQSLQHEVSGQTAASGGSSTPFTMPIDLRVQYVDLILATKD